MRRCFVILGGAILFCACTSEAQPPSTAPQAQPSATAPRTPQQPTPLVVPLTVINRDGENVLNLTQRDFHLFEDDQEQKITEWSGVNVPFNIALLLDTSSNVGFKVEDIQRAATTFVEQLRPQNPVLVASFNQEVAINTEFTTDRDQLRRAIGGVRGGGKTRLYDAVETALTKHLQPIAGRKAIVLFTAGVDSASQTATARSTIELAEKSDALIYTIRFQTANEAADSSGTQYLRDLTERTGARLYRAESTDHLSKALSMITVELRQQYSLSYYPTNAARDGLYRRLQVKVDRPDMSVYARPGYRAAKESASTR